MDAVDTRVIRAYLAHLHQAGRDPVSAARHLSALRSWFRFLVRRGVVERNVARDVRSPRLPRKLATFLPIDEAMPMVEARELHGAARVRDVAIVELLYASGLRVSELVGLDVDAIDGETMTVRVLGKGSKERVVPFGQAAARALEVYLASRPDTAGSALRECPRRAFEPAQRPEHREAGGPGGGDRPPGQPAYPASHLRHAPP